MSASPSPPAPRPTERRIRAGFAIAFVVLTLVGGMAWTCSRHSREQFLAVERSRQVLAAQAALLRELTELEEVVRGYFVTGNPIYMEQYTPGIPAAHRAMWELRRLTLEDDEHRARLKAVSRAVQRKLAMLQNYVDFRGRHTTDEVFAVVRQMKGKLVPDEARDALDALAVAERRRLAERAETAQRMSGLAIGTVLVGGVLGLAIVGLAQWAMWRELRHRRDIERELEAARAELERRVRARTVELTAFAQLGRQLNACNDVQTAGRLIVEVADGLFGWDACTFDLFDPATGRVWPVLNMDLIDGRRADVPPAYTGDKLSARMRRAVTEGAELVLREAPLALDADLTPFGDASRPSASLMIVPIRDGDRVVGVFSIQSYGFDAYSRANLNSLQALADHCGGALQRLRSRVELQQERNLLRTVVDHLPDYIYVKDTEARFRLFNAANLRLMQLDQEAAVLGRTVFDLFPAEQASAFAEDDRRVLTTGEPVVDREEPITGSDGQTRELLTTKLPLRDASGAIVGLVGLSRDITERKRAEAQLRGSEARYRLLAEHTDDFIALNHVDGRRLYLSPAYERLTGWGPGELQAVDWRKRIHPDEVALVERTRAANLRGEATTIEHRFRHKDGSWLWLETRCRPVRDTTGAVDQFVTVSRDITARKLAEEQRQLFVSLADSSQEFIGMCDREFRPFYVNPAGLKLVGLPSLEAACRVSVQEFFFPEDQPFITNEFFPRVLHEGQGEVEIRFRHFQTGATLWMLYNVFIIRDVGGATVGWATVSRDITARKRAEEILQRERNLLRTLIDLIPDSIYVRDRANRFVLANEAVARNMDAAGPAALLGYSDADFYDPGQVARLAADDQAVLAGEAKLNFEEEITDRTGERRVVLSSKVPLRDATGEVTGLVGIGRNITERKRMEESLRASEARLRTVTDTAGVGLVIVDRQHRYRYANPAYASILRLPSHDLVGQRVADVLPLVYAEQIRPRLERAFATGRVTYELTVPAATLGDLVRHYAVAYEPTTERAEPLMVVVIVDITERKRAEEALAQEHLLVAAVVNGTSDAVFLKDVAGRYQMVNAACARALGRPEGEILGHTDAELLPPETARRFRETDAAVLAAGTSQMREEEGQMPDGTHYWLANKSPWLDSDGRARGIIGVSRDISERKRSEQQLAESREQLRALLHRLQRAQAEERARVAREIHDELGQLLTGLKMDTRWLERKLSEPGLPAALHPLLDRAVAASELADQTIATVQELAAELRPSTLDQLGLAVALGQKARSFEDRTGIPCAATVPDTEPDLPPEARTELFYICQEALTNVARHAQASQVSLCLAVEGAAVVLTVTDDGKGLGPDDLTAPHSLGLLGMRERAGQCGGEIKFLANEPRGTRVVVRVQLAAPTGKEDQS